MALPTRVKVVEVGARDGLQNEVVILSAALKAELLERLSDCGLSHLEAGSFVSPSRVPQMADTDQVMARLQRRPGVTYAALTPNRAGLERALNAGVDEIAIFTAASDAFTQHNIGCSIKESLQRFVPVLELAQARQLPVRAYLSTVIDCPYQGAVAPAQVAALASELLAMGCYQVSLGDTTGSGTPIRVQRMFSAVTAHTAPECFAAHFHDTYGQALVNVYTLLQEGIQTVDTSVAGLGGCPYAPGASGNLASEDLVYLLQELGIDCGIDLPALAATGDWICAQLGRPNPSRVATALRARTA